LTFNVSIGTFKGCSPLPNTKPLFYGCGFLHVLLETLPPKTSLSPCVQIPSTPQALLGCVVISFLLLGCATVFTHPGVGKTPYLFRLTGIGPVFGVCTISGGFPSIAFLHGPTVGLLFSLSCLGSASLVFLTSMFAQLSGFTLCAPLFSILDHSFVSSPSHQPLQVRGTSRAFPVGHVLGAF